MNRTRILSLLLTTVLAGCADGGQRGTGITSAVGNVASVAGSADVGGIQVGIEGTDLATDTDAQGAFTVRGRFDGPSTLLFERASDALAARVDINAPAGGALTLANVRLDPMAGTGQADSVAVVFEGRIVSVDCGAGRATVASTQRDPADTDTYVLAIATSTVRDRHGAVRECTDLEIDDRLAIDGTYDDDGAISGEITIE
jgi:hypothetical protein